MLHKTSLFFIILLTIIASCKSKSEKQPTASNKDTTTFFPMTELLQNDADDVIKTPYYLYQRTTDVLTKKTDSTQLPRDDFKKIIAPVLAIDLRSKAEKEKYKESSFDDLSTGNISIIINAIEPNTAVKSITALLDNQTNKLKTIFITKEYISGDSSFVKKYYWKTGKSINIVTTATVNNAIVKETTQFINWQDNNLQ